MIKKRGGVYHFKFRRDNETIEGSCHTANKRTAEQIEAARKTEWALSKVGIGPKAKTPIFKDYVEQTFLPDVRINHKATPNTVKYYEASVARLLDSPLAKKKLSEIVTADITEHKGKMQKLGYSVSSINGTLRALKRILNVAMEADVIDKVYKIPQQKGQNTRDFVLREEEEAEYLAACDVLQYQVAVMMLDMGFRPEELHRLEWPQIHGDSITIYKGKTDPSRRTVKMTDRVIQVLIDRGLQNESKRESSRFVFPAPTKSGHINADSLKKQHAYAVYAMREKKADRAGVNVDDIKFWFVPYSLRHTFCTKLAETGIDAPALMYICGHRDLKTTMKYVHLASVAINDRLRDARLKLPKGGDKSGDKLFMQNASGGDNSGDSRF